MSTYVVREAKEEDVGGIEGIIRPLAKRGLLLARSQENLKAHRAGFKVVKVGGYVVACAELRVLSKGRMAEILSLGTKRGFEGQGCEAPLLRAIIEEARQRKIEKVFTVSHLTDVLEQAGFVIPASGERSILFFYPQRQETPEVNGGDEETIGIYATRLEQARAVFQLIEKEVRKGNLLPRSLGEIGGLALAGCSFVAEVAGKIVGHACLDVYNPEQAELRSLFVLNDYWGRGAAKRLIARVEHEARSRTIIELMTVTNKVELFQDLGFAFTSRLLTEARWVYPQTWKLP